MRCSRVRKLLTDYTDEALSIGVEEQVRQHLGGCRECAALAADLQSAVAALQSLPRLETSPDFTRQLRRHLPVAVALSRRAPARTGLAGWLSYLRSGSPRRFGAVLAPIAVGLSVLLYVWGMHLGLPGVGPATAEPVISEDAYLAAMAREHASYATKQPLADSSAAILRVTLAGTKAP
ncbi:MAG: hypothetical protein GX774_17415 [Armatimonadetes bacterium]|nr:hypothetical protein [Armatimonadota bacterium]